MLILSDSDLPLSRVVSEDTINPEESEEFDTSQFSNSQTPLARFDKKATRKKGKIKGGIQYVVTQPN